MANRWNALKSVIETAALVTIAAAVVYGTVTNQPLRPFGGSRNSRAARPEPPLPTEPISLAGAQTAGNPAAKVALIVYSDFQCPFCGKFARETLPTLQKEYVDTGRVLIAFRQFPLDIHPFAEKASEGSLCAARQGKFWAFHDDLFANQQPLDAASLQARASRLGLNTDAFLACLSGQAADSVDADKKTAQPFGITGTPTFLLGPLVEQGHVKVSDRFSGALPIKEFQTRLDSLLRKAGVAPTTP